MTHLIGRKSLGIGLSGLVCITLAVGIWLSTSIHAQQSPSTTNTEQCTPAQVQQMISTGTPHCAGRWSAYSPSEDESALPPSAVPESTAIGGR